MSGYLYNNKGFYQVGGQRYHSKLEACVAAARLPGQHYLHWDFHETEFGRYAWDVEPPVDILTLYRERAQQLRDSYDHLVLFYSGGADSHTVLQSFVNNGIHLDEVFVYGAFKAEQQRAKQLGFDRRAGYYTREVDYLVRPRLRQLQKQHGFKITEWDWTDRTLELLNNPDWIWKVGVRFAPDAIPRQCLHDVFGHTDRLEDRNRRVAFIFGVDKPRLFRDSHSVYLAFIDTMLTTAVGNNNDILGRNWEHDEYFYWTPNMPEIAIKQAHLIRRWLAQQGRVQDLTPTSHTGTFHAAHYYRMIHPVIYPQWDNTTWQIDKSSGVVNDEFGQWFFDSAPERSQQQWAAGINELNRSIDSRFFNASDAWQGLVGCFSKFYRIGSV